MILNTAQVLRRTSCACLTALLVACGSVDADHKENKSAISSCYQLKSVAGDRSLSEMPSVCQALTDSLNKSCNVERRKFRLNLVTPVEGLSVADWTPVPLTEESIERIEVLVRSRWQLSGLPGYPAGSDMDNRRRYESQIARRSLERAKAGGREMNVERTEVPVGNQRDPTIYFRVSASYQPDIERLTPNANSPERAELMYGQSPEIYTVEPSALDSRGRVLDYPEESISGAGQEFIFLDGSPFLATVHANSSISVSAISSLNGPPAPVAQCSVEPIAATSSR